MPQRNALCVLLALGLLTTPLIAGLAAADVRTNSVSGSASWKLGGIPVTLDSGTLSQDSSHYYVGDADCVCHHFDVFGLCNGWIATGAWYVDRWNEQFNGKQAVGGGSNSAFWLPAHAERVTYSVFAHADGYIAAKSQCQTQLNTEMTAQEAAANVEHVKFAGASGVASARARVGVGVPLTSLEVGIPLTDICSNGFGTWTGGIGSAQFDFRGQARLCIGNVGLVLTLAGTGSGPS